MPTMARQPSSSDDESSHTRRITRDVQLEHHRLLDQAKTLCKQTRADHEELLQYIHKIAILGTKARKLDKHLRNLEDQTHRPVTCGHSRCNIVYHDPAECWWYHPELITKYSVRKRWKKEIYHWERSNAGAETNNDLSICRWEPTVRSSDSELNDSELSEDSLSDDNELNENDEFDNGETNSTDYESTDDGASHTSGDESSSKNPSDKSDDARSSIDNDHDNGLQWLRPGSLNLHD